MDGTAKLQEFEVVEHLAWETDFNTLHDSTASYNQWESSS
jgi:hypothetical protein